MLWYLSDRCDPEAMSIADRHYNRQKPGTPSFTPPGRVLVLKIESKAVWATSYPYSQYVRHAWAGALICSLFRNESEYLSSLLIRQALAATRWKYPELPALGMVTFINVAKVRKKRDPGRCFRKAGFKFVGYPRGGLVALQIFPDEFPDAQPPIRLSLQERLDRL